MKYLLMISIPLALFASAAFGVASAFDCYQCNVECRNGTSEGCHFENATLGVNQTRVPCDQAEQVSGCVACVKIKTVVRRSIGRRRGKYSVVDMVSKVCQKQESAYNEDMCDYSSGQSWATNVLCHCYSDLCNSAHRLLPAAFPLLALIYYTLFFSI